MQEKNPGNISKNSEVCQMLRIAYVRYYLKEFLMPDCSFLEKQEKILHYEDLILSIDKTIYELQLSS